MSKKVMGFFQSGVNLIVVLCGDRERPNVSHTTTADHKDQANATDEMAHTADHMGLFSVTGV
jgi:hypothetical protein